MNQDAVFACEGEADRYWQRNRNGIRQLDQREDLPLRILDLYGIKPQSALEVGAADGYRLGWLNYLHRCDCLAIEPSAEAVATGSRVTPWIRFIQSTAAEMDLEGEQFDLVIVNYVLHWVDRTQLLQSVANIDGAVKDGGYLIVGDFAPSNRHKVPYHHHPGLFTFKQDYARLFLETGLYHAVAMLSTGHRDMSLDPNVPEQERYGVWLLQKQTSAHYTEVELSKGARIDE